MQIQSSDSFGTNFSHLTRSVGFDIRSNALIDLELQLRNLGTCFVGFAGSSRGSCKMQFYRRSSRCVLVSTGGWEQFGRLGNPIPFSGQPWLFHGRESGARLCRKPPPKPSLHTHLREEQRDRSSGKHLWFRRRFPWHDYDVSTCGFLTNGFPDAASTTVPNRSEAIYRFITNRRRRDWSSNGHLIS